MRIVNDLPRKNTVAQCRTFLPFPLPKNVGKFAILHNEKFLLTE